MDWHSAVEAVSPYVVKISTPRGAGTGWLVSRSATSDLCGVATAAHVINSAHEWNEPIRLFHAASGQSVLLGPGERSIHLEEGFDSAVIIFSGSQLPLPSESLELVAQGRHFKPGVEVGWLGFPAVAAAEVCFFSGRVSAFVEPLCGYLVDGVAINGVSGGPAFVSKPKLVMAGIVTAYIPNTATGDVLPGVAVLRDVRQFHDLTEGFRSFDDAKSQESRPAEAVGPSEPGVGQ